MDLGQQLVDFLNKNGLATFLVVFAAVFFVFKGWPWYTKEYFPAQQNRIKRQEDREDARAEKAQLFQQDQQQKLNELIQSIKEQTVQITAGFAQAVNATANRTTERIDSSEGAIKMEIKKLVDEVNALSATFAEVIREENAAGQTTFDSFKKDIKDGLNRIAEDVNALVVSVRNMQESAAASSRQITAVTTQVATPPPVPLLPKDL